MDAKLKKIFLYLAIAIFIFASIIFSLRGLIIESDYIGFITTNLSPSDDRTIPVLKNVESFYTTASFVLSVILIVPFAIWIKRFTSNIKNQAIVQFIYFLGIAISFEFFVFSISIPKLYYFNTIKEVKVTNGYIKEIIYKKVFKRKSDELIDLPSELKINFKVKDNTTEEEILVSTKRPYLFEGKDSEGRIKKGIPLNFYIGKDMFDNNILFKIEEYSAK